MTNDSKTPNMVKIQVIKGRVLGVDVFRGFARLCDLSNISKADVFDQKTNPTGTQRDLSPKHARDAYQYVLHREKAFWSEVFLCARDQSVMHFSPLPENPDVGTLSINYEKIRLQRKAIAISRVDGNHRLHYAGGNIDGYPAIEKDVSFCIAVGLEPKDEISLFRDINNNQKRMNTSHLDNIEFRLSEEEQLKRKDVQLFIAKQLGEDQDSPFKGKIYEGGAKPGGHMISLRSLKTGLTYMFSNSNKMPALSNPDAQYAVVKNFFIAAKKWQIHAWESPKDYLMLRGAGFWGLCFLGAHVIDRCLDEGKFSSEKMLEVLNSGKDWDWGTKGNFSGYSGRGGAKKIAELIYSEFTEDGKLSYKALAQKILDSNS